MKHTQPSVGFVSLGCPKATVDSELIITDLQAKGYHVDAAESDVDTVVVNTCGFIDAARQESLDTIEDILNSGRRVIVTGCLGKDQALLRTKFPTLEFISGPADVAPVVDAVAQYVPGETQPAVKGTGTVHGQQEARTRLTPAHYAYIKIAEGCNHTCSFCIIPDMRGKLASRPFAEIVAEAEQAVAGGAKELLLIAQDLSAYGLDLRYAGDASTPRTDLEHLARALGQLAPWVRLHYVYPYPSVDALIPLMNDGLLVPYLDLPLQHAAPHLLKAMRRPAAAEKTLERITRWREICPDLAIRSTFIVGFPGETDEDVGVLLDFLEAAELDRAGCFTYSAVEGARANALPDHVDERDKLDRQERVYEVQAEISAQRLARLRGRSIRVLVDEVSREQIIGRSMWDAPEIDGQVILSRAADTPAPNPGDFVWTSVESTDSHDIYGHYDGHRAMEAGVDRLK